MFPCLLYTSYILKKIGPRAFEDELNPGARDKEKTSAGGEPIPNDIFTRTLEQVDTWRPHYESGEVREKLSGIKVLLASTDVHEHGLLLIDRLLTAAGALVDNIGAERNPDEVVSEAAKHRAEMVFISTHNGMALEYARNLLDEMEEEDYKVPVCMGGVLNQNTAEGTTPVDVSGELEMCIRDSCCISQISSSDGARSASVKGTGISPWPVGHSSWAIISHIRYSAASERFSSGTLLAEIVSP